MPHDVIIVGAGPAGLAAACRLHRSGITDVVVLDREQWPGGVPRHCGHRTFGIREFGRPLTGPQYAERMIRRAQSVDIRTGVSVTKLQPDGHVTITSQQGVEQIAARRVLLTTGARETPRAPRMVSGTRPSGVLTTGSLQQMVYLAGMRPFDRPVIIGSELVAFSALLTLRHAGIKALAIIEPGSRITARRPCDLVARWLLGIPVLTGARLVAIHGARQVEAVEIEQTGKRETIACDGIVFSGQFVPEAALIQTSHLELDRGTGGPVIDQCWRCSDPTYFAAGNLLHPIETAGVAYREGAAAGASIAASLRGALRLPDRRVRIHVVSPMRYIYPQVIANSAPPPNGLMFNARVEREVRGRLTVRFDDEAVWSRHIHALPERRVRVPAAGLAVTQEGHWEVRLDPG